MWAKWYTKLERYYVFNAHDEEDLAVGVREGVEEDVARWWTWNHCLHQGWPI